MCAKTLFGAKAREARIEDQHSKHQHASGRTHTHTSPSLVPLPVTDHRIKDAVHRAGRGDIQAQAKRCAPWNCHTGELCLCAFEVLIAPHCRTSEARRPNTMTPPNAGADRRDLACSQPASHVCWSQLYHLFSHCACVSSSMFTCTQPRSTH